MEGFTLELRSDLGFGQVCLDKNKVGGIMGRKTE